MIYTCTRCGEPKPQTEFHKDRTSKKGVVSRCKTCVQKDSKAKYPERKAYYQEYGQQHREQINARVRIKNRTRNREKRNQLRKDWRARHPLEFKRTTVNANASKYGASERVKLAEIETLWEAQGGVCPYTQMPLIPHKAVLHHIVHLKNGGSNTITNMVFVTRQAHQLKRHLSLGEFCKCAWLDYLVVIGRIQCIHKSLSQLLSSCNKKVT